MSGLKKQIAQPDLTSVLRESSAGTKASLNAVNIGIIQSFNSSNQTASVQIALRLIKEVKPDGTRVIVEHPLLLQCPVMTLFGGESFINLPIQQGDNCIVLFNDREIDNWLLNGGVQTPTSKRVHDISDAIAIVGIRSFQNSISQFLANGIRISFNADSRMDFTEDEINSIADLFTHEGNMLIDGSLTITGDVYGNGGGTLNFDTNLIQPPGREIHAGNGATGTFSNTITVVDGIVTGGT